MYPQGVASYIRAGGFARLGGGSCTLDENNCWLVFAKSEVGLEVKESKSSIAEQKVLMFRRCSAAAHSLKLGIVWA